jgi:hypothetical protein
VLRVSKVLRCFVSDEGVANGESVIGDGVGV